MVERIVINTGPLVTLALIEALDVPEHLPYEFLCPSEVRAELDAGAAVGHIAVNPSWLKVQPLQTVPSPLALSALDAGEAAVIQLALEQQIPLVCIDEWKGRRVALAVGLRVMGTLGLLNQTTGHWYRMAHGEKTLAVRAERSRASGEVEAQAGRACGGLRLRCATLRPNGDGLNRQ